MYKKKWSRLGFTLTCHSKQHYFDWKLQSITNATSNEADVRFKELWAGRGTTANNSEKIAPFSFLRTVGNSVGKTDTSKSGRITIIQRLERWEKNQHFLRGQTESFSIRGGIQERIGAKKTVDAKMATGHFLQTVIFYEVMKLMCRCNCYVARYRTLFDAYTQSKGE